MNDITITTETNNISVSQRSIDITTEEKVIQVNVTGGRGPAGKTPVRLLYAADVAITGGPSSAINSVTVLLNTTGKTFTWDKLDMVNCRLTCTDDTTLLDKAISITWYRLNTTQSNLHTVRTNLGSLILGDSGFSGGTFRCLIEFYNY